MVALLYSVVQALIRGCCCQCGCNFDLLDYSSVATYLQPQSLPACLHVPYNVHIHIHILIHILN